MNLATNTSGQTKLAFVHIPKTAGTAFRVSLIEAVGAAKVFSIGDDCSPQEWAGSLVASDIEDYSVICGHSEASNFKRFGFDLVFATLVRDPIARAASLYNFTLRRRPDSALARKLKGKSLEWAATNIPAFKVQVSNVQCKFICGETSAKDALYELRTSEWLVRDDVEIEKLTQDVSKRMGWPVPAPGQYNVGRSGYLDDIFTPGAREALEAINQEDIALMEAVRSQSLVQSD